MSKPAAETAQKAAIKAKGEAPVAKRRPAAKTSVPVNVKASRASATKSAPAAKTVGRTVARKSAVSSRRSPAAAVASAPSSTPEPAVVGLTVEALTAALSAQTATTHRRSVFRQTVLPSVIALAVGFAVGTSGSVSNGGPVLTAVSPSVQPTTAIAPVASNAFSPTSTPSPSTTTVAQAIAAAPPVTGAEIAAISGDAPRQSAPFVLDGRPASLRFETNAGTGSVRLLQLNVAGAGELVAECTEACAITTLVNKTPGTYFLDVTSANATWTVKVFQ